MVLTYNCSIVIWGLPVDNGRDAYVIMYTYIFGKAPIMISSTKFVAIIRVRILSKIGLLDLWVPQIFGTYRKNQLLGTRKSTREYHTYYGPVKRVKTKPGP